MATDGSTPASPALVFGAVAQAYDRGRPGYPREAVEWLTGPEPLSILELGAGTGKLTEHLLALGHDVHATDPDPRMLDRLGARLGELRVSQTTAEEIPAADATYDLVVVADAFEYFDHDRALPEIARVLKRGGSLALVRNVRDERIPWVKRLGNLIGHHALGTGPGEELESSPYFGPTDEATFKQWQVIHRASVQDLVRSLGDVAGLPADAQEARIREVLAFYDDFGRGMDGMQLPYVTECFRAVVGIQPKTIRKEPERAADDADQPGGTGSGAEAGSTEVAGPVGKDSIPVVLAPAVEPPADDDTGMLLIRFR
ncbi:class I SAM-dependent methyltransferase [Nocardioides sp. zg-536]|uniref:Class I SAM-dependent methyltransferase n=1 Tax=Nocardioides faecalis TaxID=2803858 RepID=A0A939BWK7_9ACTN|nr:class I SAM-dependent methyltransferase [Nocardioides faecalis]MBM9461141.1 class I SAM-dependent methyltransferase [Nocardioides faecalis]QVI58994.1 class I SAM-dependent methyltransferase [Nocardioides faecalis]